VFLIGGHDGGFVGLLQWLRKIRDPTFFSKPEQSWLVGFL
jgi:hypothetical protein